MALFRHLAWFFRDHWRTYLLALAMLTGVGLLNMAVPFLVGRAVDALVEAGPSRHDETLLLLLGLGLCVYGLRFGWRQILFGTSYRLGTRLRNRYYRRLTRQGPAFFAAHHTGDLMARATNDIDAIELAAGEGVLSGFDGLLTLLLVLGMMLAVIDWRLTLVALLPFPVMALAFYRISNAVHHHFGEALERFSRLNDKAQEALAGIRLTKAMGREEAESRRFADLAQDAADSNFRVARAEALYDPVIFLCLAATLLLILGYGGWLVRTAQLSVGQLTAFTMYMAQLIWPMFAFGWLLNIVQRGSAAFTRVDALLQTPDSLADRGRARPARADLRVRDLDFHYPDSPTPALQGIAFDLPEGAVLGLVGPTGAGKSTLVQLLMRHWQSPPGAIQLDGRALDAYPLGVLRDQFAYVPQDAFLFSASIADNIALARPDASLAAIEAVARVAAIHDEIGQFADGYRTLVGERGVTLSGGQRQRIAIARALLSEAPILILDDALSAVDVHTEQQILDHLRRRVMHRRQSSLIVSHRLSALSHADEILVLGHGALLERGDHRQLLHQDGWYARMYRYQQLEASLDAY